MKNATIEIAGKTYEMIPAVIERTEIGDNDHGGFSPWLHVRWGASGQGAGGYALDEPLLDADKKFLGRQGTAFGMEWILSVLRTLRVDSWEKLPGTHLFILKVGGFGNIDGIAHITEPDDRSFVFSQLAERFYPKKEQE